MHRRSLSIKLCLYRDEVQIVSKNYQIEFIIFRYTSKHVFKFMTYKSNWLKAYFSNNSWLRWEQLHVNEKDGLFKNKIVIAARELYSQLYLGKHKLNYTQ